MSNLTKNQQIAVVAVIIVLLLCICSVLGVIVWARSPLFGGSTTPSPEGALPGDGTRVPGANDCWERVKANGKMVVGTTQDYAPFEYINENYTLDGFDVAMMIEIGKRLNMPLDIKMMAFDGLGYAVQTGQLDTAVAAISVTSQRQQSFDFSDVYYSSQDGILANQNSNISSVSSPADMTGKRVGVERGTVYEKWAQANLVNTGIIPAKNLLVYAKIGDAVNDLTANRVDLVMTDLPVAQNLVAQGGVKLVGQGLDPQLYAIGAAKGCTGLITEINKALKTLQNDGTLAKLAEKYLHSQGTGVQPQPTPVPNQPTATAAPCQDGMAFVQDLNFPDNNMTSPPVFAPGTPFMKGWRIRNTGTCTWNTNYFIMYVNGNVPAAQMAGQPTNVKTNVPPGANYDMYVSLVAPMNPGIYQGFWQMRNPQGVFFGQTVWVGIQVVQPGTTATPVAAPVIQSFVVQPSTIGKGGCVSLSWQVVGQVNTVDVLRNSDTIWANAAVNGTMNDCPPGTGKVTYKVVARGNGGEMSASASVTIKEAPAPTATKTAAPPTATKTSAPTQTVAPDKPTLTPVPPTATKAPPTPTKVPPQPTPAPPVIKSFTVDPKTIFTGDCVNGSWSVTGETSNIQIFRNNALLAEHIPAASSGSDCYTDSTKVTYTLVAIGKDGKTVSKEQIITVKPSKVTLTLVSYVDASGTMTNVAGATITANIDAKAKTVSGETGCNTYNGPYTLSGENLTIGPLTTSKKVCPSPELTDQESAFLANMQSATGFNSSGSQFNLVKGGTVILIFNQPVSATPY